LETAVATPLIDVDPVEVDCSVRGGTSKVSGDRRANIRIIVGSVAYGDLAISLGLHVGLDIAYSRFDESTGTSVGVIVRDFVSGEISEDIGVGGKLVDDTDISLEDFNSPRWVVAVDGLAWRRQIRDDIDTYRQKKAWLCFIPAAAKALTQPE